jgi:hypothetical protein
MRPGNDNTHTTRPGNTRLRASKVRAVLFAALPLELRGADRRVKPHLLRPFEFEIPKRQP